MIIIHNIIVQDHHSQYIIDASSQSFVVLLRLAGHTCRYLPICEIALYTIIIVYMTLILNSLMLESFHRNLYCQLIQPTT